MKVVTTILLLTNMHKVYRKLGEKSLQGNKEMTREGHVYITPPGARHGHTF